MTSTILPRSELTSSLSGWQGGEGGEGPPLLLIHGVGLRAEAWSPMLPILNRHFAVTAVDLPGHGESAKLQDGDQNSLNEFTDRIAELLPSPSQKVLVMGHSLGALIALDLAIKHADKVAAVVPLNAIYRRSTEAKAAVLSRVGELAHNDIPDPTQTLLRWFGEQPQGDGLQMAQACRQWLTQVDRQGYHDAYKVFAENDGPADSDLKSLPFPALFVTGPDEPNSTPDMSHAMAGLVPRGRAVIIDGARHMMPMTHAAEVCAHLLEFVKHLDGTHAAV